MSIEIVQSEYGFANLKFSSKPSKELLDELKSNGWGWSSNNGVWYPRSQAARENNQMFAYRFVAKYDPETARKYSEQQVNDYAAEIKQSVQSDLPEPTEQIETLKEFTERIVQPIVEEYQKKDELKYQEQINSLNENSKKVYELLKATGNLTVEEMLVMVSKIDNAYATNNFEIENENEENDKEIINKLADDIIQEAYDNSASGFNYYLDYEEAARLCGKTKDWIVSHINEIDDALMFHNDDELLDYVGEHEEPDSFNLNFCSVGEDHNELFKKENGRWIRKTDEELQEEGFNLDNKLTDSENNLSPDSETLAYDRVTNRYKEQYADFYKTFAQIQEMHLENESRYVSNARIREQYNQAFEELVKLSKQELVDIICEGINFEDSKSSAIRYINSVSPDVQRRMMCTTFGFKNYLDIDNRPTLGRMENGKYIAPTSEEINTYIKDEYDCNRLNGISIAELYQIKREARDEGLPVKKMQTFINQYEEAKNTNDEKTIKKIEYYLEDIDYDTEVDLLRNGNYEELRNKYANITFGVLPLVEFVDNEPEMYDSIEDAFRRMEELNANNFINNNDLRYGISFHYDNGDYNNGNYIAIYEPFSYSQQNKLDITIFEADSHFRTPVVKNILINWKF